MYINHIYLTSTFVVLLLAVASTAYVANAQLDNKPFSFKGTPDGGIGISAAGKQAIINYENFNIKPSTLLKGSDGQLLSVTEGVGTSVIVTPQGSGEIFAAYKGASYKGDNSAMSAGAFNAYFVPSSDNSNSRSSYNQFVASSSETVSTWTSRVATGGYPASYSLGSVVDNWTSLVFIK
jgi:hypothetical protein